MKHPGRGYSFDIKPPADFLAALQQDLKDFEQNQSSRHALHCAFLGWHMHEWVWGQMLKGDPSLQKKVFGCYFDGIGKFQKHVRRECPDLEALQGVAEGSKHLGTSAQVKGTVSDLGTSVPGRAVPGQMVLGSVGFPGVTLHDGRTVFFLGIVSNAVTYWERIINSLQESS
jgi:hypothetical protein